MIRFENTHTAPVLRRKGQSSVAQSMLATIERIGNGADRISAVVVARAMGSAASPELS
jgi:hypothetical protein